MLPLALGEDVYCAIAAGSGLQRGWGCQYCVIFSGKNVLSLSATRLLLLSGRLLMASEAFTADVALPQLDPLSANCVRSIGNAASSAART